MTDIVELLRNGWTTVPQVLAAADEIERLRAERDALRDDAERYKTKREIDWLAASRKHDALFANEKAWKMSYDAAIDAARKS